MLRSFSAGTLGGRDSAPFQAPAEEKQSTWQYGTSRYLLLSEALGGCDR